MNKDDEEELLNCWEIRKCGREKGGEHEEEFGECPVSEMNMGHSCWVIAGSFHDGEPYCPRVKNKKIRSCIECGVFKMYSRTGPDKGKKIKECFPEENQAYMKLMAERFKKSNEE